MFVVVVVVESYFDLRMRTKPSQPSMLLQLVANKDNKIRSKYNQDNENDPYVYCFVLLLLLSTR